MIKLRESMPHDERIAKVSSLTGYRKLVERTERRNLIHQNLYNGKYAGYDHRGWFWTNDPTNTLTLTELIAIQD